MKKKDSGANIFNQIKLNLCLCVSKRRKMLLHVTNKIYKKKAYSCIAKFTAIMTNIRFNFLFMALKTLFVTSMALHLIDHSGYDKGNAI